MPFAYLCDFDGTVSPADIGAALIQRFTVRTPAESEALIESWRAGRMGNRDIAAAECEGVRVTVEQALAFTRGFTLDPHFVPFVAAAGARGETVAVVSEGFDFYVRDQLERSGLAAIPWSANRVRFEGDRMSLEFPAANGGCDSCGNCKGAHVRRHQRLGYEVVLVGDGLSDRCGARAADRVLARGDLLAWCRSEGVEALPFESFADVAAFSDRLAATAPRGRNSDAESRGSPAAGDGGR